MVVAALGSTALCVILFAWVIVETVATRRRRSTGTGVQSSADRAVEGP
jgi:hypothetical protein